MLFLHKTVLKKCGFTFLEIIIALGLLSVIMGIGYSAVAQIIRGKKTLDDIREVKSSGDTLMLRFTREIQLAALEKLLPPSKSKQPTPSQLFLLGVKGESFDEITFITYGTGQYIPDAEVLTPKSQISYKVSEKSDNDDETDDNSKGKSLIRTEVPMLAPPTRAYKNAIYFPLVDNLTSFKLNYFDSKSESWVDEWGKAPHEGLPALIKVAFSLISPLGKVVQYSTIVAIQAGKA